MTAKERLEHAQRELTQMRARLNRGSTFTVVIGFALLVLLGVYFWIGSKLWAEVTEPKQLVNYVYTQIDDYIPEARKMVEREVKKNAPTWAKELSKEALAYVPEARKHLQEIAITELEKSLEKTELVTEEEFRKFLRKHRSMVEQRLKGLAKDPGAANREITELFNALEDDMQVDLKADAAKLLKLVKSLNRNMRDMQHGAELSEGQKLERQTWMIARRIYLQTFEPALLRKFEAAGQTQKTVVKRKLLPKDLKGKKPKSDPKPEKSGRVDQDGRSPFSVVAPRLDGGVLSGRPQPVFMPVLCMAASRRPGLA
jgi:hypothetical protein